MYKIYLYTHSFIFKYHRRCEMKEVFINSEYITLAQLLKLEGFIGSGGEAKYFLQEVEVEPNGELENRRGKKLYSNDVIKLEGNEFKIINEN